MQRIDAHQHFWHYSPVRDGWITDDMAVIQQDFLPADLQLLLQRHQLDGCVAVQANQSEAETAFLLDLAAKHEFIKGVVGWVDLTASDVESRLVYYSGFPKLAGFRHVLQAEAQRDYMLRDDFTNGLSLLNRFGFTYDILVYPDQLQYIPELLVQFPEQRFVLDHIGKPAIKEKTISEWKQHIQRLGTFKNLYCKISGLVTEADWNEWVEDDFTAYLDTVVESFGFDRVMYGSDWPVCLVAASYNKTLSIVKNYFAKYRKETQHKFFSGNAIEFYKLK